MSLKRGMITQAAYIHMTTHYGAVKKEILRGVEEKRESVAQCSVLLLVGKLETKDIQMYSVASLQTPLYAHEVSLSAYTDPGGTQCSGRAGWLLSAQPLVGLFKSGPCECSALLQGVWTNKVTDKFPNYVGMFM